MVAQWGQFDCSRAGYLRIMAESQVPFPYQPAEIAALRLSLSEPRFATYLKKAGNHEEYAIALYLYNSRLAKSFLFPLGMAEVTLRNAVDPILVSRYGANWHLDQTFRNHVLSEESLRSLDKARQRAGLQAPRDQVVATLTFDFWSNLFRHEYGAMWRTTVNIAFPNLAHGRGRKEVQDLVKAINDFRNRVAHHEPILDYNVTEVYSKIVQLIELKCAQTAAWMKHHSTVSAVTRTRPKLSGAAANSLESRLDKEFLSVSQATAIKDVVASAVHKHPVIICVDATGRPEAAFTVTDVMLFLSECAAKADGLVALPDHSIGDLINRKSFSAQWLPLDCKIAFGLAVKELQKPRIQIVVGVEGKTGKAIGALLRAHRRY